MYMSVDKDLIIQLTIFQIITQGIFTYYRINSDYKDKFTQQQFQRLSFSIFKELQRLDFKFQNPLRLHRPTNQPNHI